ncbi:MAG: N-acetylmuramoyl-L-alanine amidase, partial [Candidatus Hydrogenedentes bacterium CG07_land_8_20_14_0_80_42_17]
MQIGKCKLETANWKVQTENCKLESANWKVQIGK